jgi:hypothetical protein
MGDAQPASSGRQVRCGIRQSIPSSSIDSWARLSTTTPSSARGQTNRPRSRRLANRHSPSPSHHNSLTRSPRRPRKQNTWPQKRILPEHGLRLRRQTVETLAHVGGAGRQPHPGARRQRVHRSSSITCRSVSELTSPRRRTRAPQPNAISIIPSRSVRRGRSPSGAILNWHHCAAVDRCFRQQLPPPLDRTRMRLSGGPRPADG